MRDDDKYMLLSFDTESDQGSWTENYTSIDHALPVILEMLDEKGIKATFFWTAQAAMHNPQMIKETHNRDHEVACHGYKHESLGKPSYFIPGDRPVLREEITIRVRRSTEIITDMTGVAPRSFRAPRGWGGEILLQNLEELGYLVDASYMIGNDKGSIWPYHPDSDDWTKPGGMEILEIPNSGLSASMLNETSTTIRDFSKKMSLGSPVEGLGQWPVLRMFGARPFFDYLQPFANTQLDSQGYAIVSVYQHPWEFLPMPGIHQSPEGRTELTPTLYENCGQFALDALAECFDLFKTAGFQFATMQQLYSLWEGDSHDG